MASALLCGSAVAALPQVEWVGIEVNAASFNGFEYEYNWEGGITILRYSGTKKDITIPSSIAGTPVTRIAGCEPGTASYSGPFIGVESIVIPDSVKTIDYFAFSYNTDLKKITFGSGVSYFETSVDFYGFGGDEDVRGEGQTFGGCTNLKEINVSASNKYYSSQNGILFNKNKTVLLAYPLGKTGSYRIPDSVVTVGYDAFCESKISEVTLSSNVRTVETGAFAGCSNLKSVTMPYGIKKITGWSFNNDPNLKTVTIPESVTLIGNHAFGYHYPESNDYNETKVYGFTIKGKAGSVANEYASANGFKFVSANTAPITLSSTQMSLGKGETTKLTATVNLSNKTVAWRTSDSKILTVDKNGNVKAVGTGTAWITARTSNGLEKSCKITVKNAPTKITLTKGILTIGVGQKYTLGAGINDGAGCAKRTYRTSNSSVVKMTRTDWNGDFYGVKPGIAYVTVRTYNGKESTCKVTVKAAPTSVTISKKTLNLKVGATATLSCSIPSNAGCALRTFRTSNSNVVKMTKTNWTGSFKAVAPGTAYVTVRTYNGKESTCKVTVTR